MSLRDKAKLNGPFSKPVPIPATLFSQQSPREHQLVAVEDCRKGLVKDPAGRLHMPCGTGKTLVGMYLAMVVSARVILVVVPSIGLLKQTLVNWKQNSPFKFDHLAVCSDEKVDDDISPDELLVETTVTRDASRIAEFMRGPGVRVVFSTYASSDRCGYGSNTTKGFDLVIADEAHHLGSARDDGHAAPFRLPNRLNAKRRVYMTATPYRLANFPDIFGPTFHQLTQPDAVTRGLLCPTKTVILYSYAPTVAAFLRENPWVTSTLIDQMTPSELCSHILAAQAVDDYKLKRVLSFHNLVAGARTFASQHQGVEDALHASCGDLSLRCTYIAGHMKIGLREAKIAGMRSSGEQARLLASAKCINEGCDIPGVDGVLFVDPKNSVESIIQCAGRASRLHPGKKVGYVLLPVLVTDADIENPPSYGMISHVVQAMQELDPGFRVRLQAARIQSASGDPNVELPEDLILRMMGGTPLPPNFLLNFSTMILRSSAESWEMKAAELGAYAAKNGLTALATDPSPEAAKLRKWMHGQRKASAAGKGEGHALSK